MAERCVIHRLPVEKLDDAVGDPALAALLAEGWDVMASVVVDKGDGHGPVLRLLLRPPRPKARLQAGTAAIPGWAWAFVGVLASVLVYLVASVAW